MCRRVWFSAFSDWLWFIERLIKTCESRSIPISTVVVAVAASAAAPLDDVNDNNDDDDDDDDGGGGNIGG